MHLSPQLSRAIAVFSFAVAALLSLARVSPAHAAPLAQSPVIVGAGDIADCTDPTPVVSETADLLDNIEGTVFTLGDNVQDMTAVGRYEDCYDPYWGRHKARTMPAAGNWDYDDASPGPDDYYTYFKPAASPMEPGCTNDCLGYYSYDIGEWHIVVLNSETFTGTDSPQFDWLQTDLLTHPSTCILAYWHHPRFSSGSGGGGTSNVGPFWAALQAAGADIVLNGHRHIYEHLAPRKDNGTLNPGEGIRQFVVGTGGGELVSFGSPLAGTIARDNSTHGVLKLTLHPTAYEWEFIPIEGQTFTDVGSTTCTGSPGSGVVIFSTSPDPTTTSPIPVTVRFDVNVTGFVASDLAITNGTVDNFTLVDARTYTFDLIPDAPGEVTVNVAAGVAQDATANSNTAAAPFSIVVVEADTAPPAVTLSSTAPNPTNVSPIPVTVQFSENVSGFDQSDIGVNNGTISNFVVVDGDTYTFDVTPVAPGEVTVIVAAGVATDAAGNPNTAAEPLIRTYVEPDTTPPTVTINSTASNPTSVSPIPVTVQFSEIVIGFDANAIGVSNGTISNFIAIDGDTYTFDVTPAVPGDVTLTIAAGVATDEAGNPNSAAAPLTRTFEQPDPGPDPDTTPPSVTVNQAAGQADPTTTSPVNFLVTFSEPVTGFGNGDVTIGGTAGATTAVVSQIAPNDGTTYNVAVSGMTNSGTVILSIPAGVVADASGNENLASTSTDNTVTVTVEGQDADFSLLLPLIERP